MASFRLTRIAPTPSGFLHLGNAFSFLLTQAIAQRTGAALLLRIDDMDQQRMQPVYLEDIFDTLAFLGIQWQQGPLSPADFVSHYSQQNRQAMYNIYLDRLAHTGTVFACTCSRTDVLRHSPDGVYPGTCLHKQIPLDTPGAAWRLHTQADAQVCLHRLEQPPLRAGLPPAMRYMVVRKKDAMPAYQLCSLADDILFGVDLIVRGADLLPSTIAQLYLASILQEPSFSHTVFYHHPLLLSASGEKLSKSAGDTSLQYLRSQGIIKENVLQMIAKLAGLHQKINSSEELAAAMFQRH